MTSHVSIITPSARLNENDWSATLVCDKSKSSVNSVSTCTSLIPNCHARIIFEGVEDDNYFFIIAHFMGMNEDDSILDRAKLLSNTKQGRVKLLKKKERDDFRNTYIKKTATYVVTRSKIEKLIKKIEQEAEKPYPFTIFGDKSVFAKEAGYFKIYDALLIEIQKRDPNLFLRLYDSSQNESKCTGMSKEEFDKSIERTINIIRKTRSDLLEEGVKYNYTYVVKLFNEESVNQKNLQQQSCFTWARKHLKSIGIELPCAKIECIASVTRIQAKYQMEDDVSISIIGEKEKAEEESESTKENKIPLGALVTYNTHRDTRTEAWKQISGSITVNDIALKFGIGGTIVSGAGIWGGVGVGIAVGCGAVVGAPIVLPIIAGVALGGGAIAAVGTGIALAVSSHKLKKAQNIENAKELLTEEELQKYEKVREKEEPITRMDNSLHISERNRSASQRKSCVIF